MPYWLILLFTDLGNCFGPLLSAKHYSNYLDSIALKKFLTAWHTPNSPGEIVNNADFLPQILEILIQKNLSEVLSLHLVQAPQSLPLPELLLC